MVTYSAKNVNAETNSPSDEGFSAPAGWPAAGGGAAKRRPIQKPLRTFRSQRLLCFCYAPACSRSLKIRSVDLLGDLLRTEIDDDNAVGFPGLPFIGVEIEIDVLGIFLRVPHRAAAARGGEVQEKGVIRRPAAVEAGADGGDLVADVIVVAILHAQRLAAVDHGLRGGVGENGAVALIRPAEVQPAAIRADLQLVVKAGGEHDPAAHRSQGRDLVFQIPALGCLIDHLVERFLHGGNVVLAVFGLHAHDDRFALMLVEEGVDVFEYVSQRERSGKRGVGDLASGDVVLEHERLLTGALFEHQTHIEIAVAIFELRGDARILTLEDVAHVDVLRAAVVRAGDGHAAELCLVGYILHPVDRAHVGSLGRRRGKARKDADHHAHKQSTGQKAAFDVCHDFLSSSIFALGLHCLCSAAPARQYGKSSIS